MLTPSLESITIRAKYSIPFTDFSQVQNQLCTSISKGILYQWKRLSYVGNSLALMQLATNEGFENHIKTTRPGVPFYFSLIEIDENPNNILVEVECRPIMWYRISNLGKEEFSENEIQEALLENKAFVRQVMSIFKGKEIEPISVYPIIKRAEIKNNLVKLGLNVIVIHLDKAETHIAQSNFEESLKSSRTAFEKMVDWEIAKRGLEKTNNYKNDLERLQSKGFLDKITTELIQTYYRCLSNIAVHSKGDVPPGLHEAELGYAITLIMLRYLTDKLP